jgi:hypothetical protein
MKSLTKVWWQSVVMCIICLADMVSTCIVVGMGLAVEANPLMAYFMNQGIVMFILAKSLSFVVPIFIIEYMRPRYKNPILIQRFLTAGVVIYALVYILGSISFLI